MNPNALDVQLLQVFDALMQERHVTKAARQLGLSQSALSHALGRLRDRLGDPLLIRTSKGMEPTARALELVGPVREAIRQVEAVFRSDPFFDPLQSKESFVIRIGDSNEFLLLPPLLRELSTNAPHVSVVIRHLSPIDTLKCLEDGTIDFAVSALLRHSKSIRSIALMRDRMVCAMNREHPCARKPLTVDRFLSLSHIRVVQDNGDSRFVDDALRARHVSRRVVATIPHWLVALHAVSSSGLVVAASERMARRFDTENRLVLRKLPLGVSLSLGSCTGIAVTKATLRSAGCEHSLLAYARLWTLHLDAAIHSASWAGFKSLSRETDGAGPMIDALRLSRFGLRPARPSRSNTTCQGGSDLLRRSGWKVGQF